MFSFWKRILRYRNNGKAGTGRPRRAIDYTQVRDKAASDLGQAMSRPQTPSKVTTATLYGWIATLTVHV